MVKLWKAKGDVLEFHKDPHDVAHVVPNLVALFLSLTPSDAIYGTAKFRGGMGDTTGIGGTCNTYDTSGREREEKKMRRGKPPEVILEAEHCHP
ncbi:hypothetical protein JHK87_001471 [Glycine soja]|nr:hypothetical protein JHK87_001471 [Glycine soja]